VPTPLQIPAALLLAVLFVTLPAARAQVADHGGDVNAELFTYKNDPTVPLHPPDRPLAKFELKDKIYHGVILNTESQANFDQAYAKYIGLVGKKPTMICTYVFPWSNGVPQAEDKFYKKLTMIGALPNVVPLIKLYTCDWRVPGPMMKADDILAGKDDAYFLHLAQMSKQFGKPFLLSIDHEMNGSWFSYSQYYNRGGTTDWTAAKYIQIWRKIYKIFQDNGATNVAFAWCPAAIGKPFGAQYDALNSYKAYYPGDDVVDWVGASCYNDVNPYAIDNLAASYPNKPIVIAEWATEAARGASYRPLPYPGDAAYLQMTLDMFTTRYPNLKAITYTEWGPKNDLDRVPAQVDIYRTAIAKPIFYNND
jgi:hypothetical protein